MLWLRRKTKNLCCQLVVVNRYTCIIVWFDSSRSPGNAVFIGHKECKMCFPKWKMHANLHRMSLARILRPLGFLDNLQDDCNVEWGAILRFIKLKNQIFLDDVDPNLFWEAAEKVPSFLSRAGASWRKIFDEAEQKLQKQSIVGRGGKSSQNFEKKLSEKSRNGESHLYCR